MKRKRLDDPTGIRAKLKSAGLKGNRAARLLRVSPSFLSQVLLGRKRLPPAREHHLEMIISEFEKARTS